MEASCSVSLFFLPSACGKRYWLNLLRINLHSSSSSCPLHSNPRVSNMPNPRFWSTPFRYLRWASHEQPALFYSVVIGCLGPVMLVVVPPIRKRLGYSPREMIPLTYPSKYLPGLANILLVAREHMWVDIM